MCRVMNVLDGFAVVKALKKDYKICVITGGDDPMVRHRIHYLGIIDYYAKVVDLFATLGHNIPTELIKGTKNDESPVDP